MNARAKFLKMFDKMPEKAREELICHIERKFALIWFGENIIKNTENIPMSLNVCCIEIKNNTELGKEILKKLGFEDDLIEKREISFYVHKKGSKKRKRVSFIAR